MAELGGLVGIGQTAMLNPPLAERVKKMEVTREGIRFSDRVTLPCEPFIGTLGVSPEIEAVSSVQTDYWGGNMDLPDMAPGAVACFPVFHEGALIYLGDCHGTQGDGELSGVAVEKPATVTLQIDPIKGWQIAWPRLETAERIMTIGSARPMEDAARIADRELVRWLAADYGFEEIEAYMQIYSAAARGLAASVRLLCKTCSAFARRWVCSRWPSAWPSRRRRACMISSCSATACAQRSFARLAM